MATGVPTEVESAIKSVKSLADIVNDQRTYIQQQFAAIEKSLGIASGTSSSAAEDEATKTNIFQQQEGTIKLLTDVLQNQGTGQSPVYVSAPADAEQAAPKSPNYLLGLGIAAAAFLLLKKSRVF